ncbi:MAG: M81 family metallopeptidase [Proteobacteria bacterium]|nr:M81 family metallopeptidase [Pseudomonadota bacterium]MBI3496358.1 M81 family metallopeptidase [Pseudomonadota bacterium]
MRIFTATLSSETNTASPLLTGRAQFEETLYAPPGCHPDHPTLYTGPLWVLRRRAREEGWTLIEGLCANATTGGLVVRKVYEELRDTILDQLHSALPLDCIILGLHSGMSAEGYEDCEGDILARARAIVGKGVKIGAELDPHGTITQAMVEAADTLVCFKESPHTDFLERAEELVTILTDAAQGRTRPVMSLFDCRMILSSPTNREPLAGFIRRIKALEGKDGVLSISIGHCFGLSDVADMGYKILVVTDERKEAGDRLAELLGRELFAMRKRIGLSFLSIDQALDEALATEGAPVVISDGADNAGAGNASDSTFLIKRMLARGIREAAVGPLWDPIAVKLCFAAGEGARMPLRFGAKIGPNSGEPVDALVTVSRLVANATQSFGNAVDPLGDAAAIEFDGIAVVLNSTRTQAFGTDLFSNLGIDPRARRIVVVKSHNHFSAAFSPIAAKVIRCAAPGPMPLDYSKVDYKRVRRPRWPLDADPFGPAAPV